MPSLAKSLTPALILLTLLGASLPGTESKVGLPSSAPSDISELKELESRASDAIQKSLPAIVAVDILPKAIGRPAIDHVAQCGGSGVIINRDGLILSQFHVSHMSREVGKKSVPRGPGEKIEIALQDGRRLHAELLGTDPVRDLSLLRIIEPGVYPHLELAKPNAVASGDWVLKLGHPYGYRQSRGATARLGRVLFMGESIEIVADCMTFGGDSGGPLINLQGQVIGILENASAPQIVIWSLPERCGNPTCYSSTDTIARLMPGMLNPPRDAKLGPDFDVKDVPEHKTMMVKRLKELYGDMDAKVIPLKDWTQGEQTRAKWKDLTALYRGSVVEVLGPHRRVALGTVVGADGWILTKASELQDDPRCRLANDQVLSAKVVGVDAANDLALLKIEAQGLHAVEWSAEKVRPAGKLVAAPDGRGGSIGVGMVSVAQRTLEGPFPTTVTRSKEYVPKPSPPEVLGKMVQGKGLLVRRAKDAAAKAGIVPGDLLLKLNGRPIGSHDDVDHCVEKLSPGDLLPIVLERASQQMSVSVKLGEEPYARCPGATARYRNLRADDFPAVFEHDIPVLLDECGGPVIDLNGKAVGVTIARVAQHGCMAIPGDVVAGVVSRLKKK